MNSYAWNVSLLHFFLLQELLQESCSQSHHNSCTSNSNRNFRISIRIFLICSLYAWKKKAFWSHLKREQVRAFPYQSPWTNLLGPWTVPGHSEDVFHQPGTHIFLCWKQLLRLLQQSRPICIATIMLTDMQLTEQDIWPGRTALLKTGMLPPLELTFNARTPKQNSSHCLFPLMLAIKIPLPTRLV